MYDYYNLSCVVPKPKSLVRDVLTRYVNCVVKALNDCTKLPRAIIIIPDDDILKFIDHNSDGIEKVVNTVINWINNNMIRAIECKREDLRSRKSGAVVSYEPKIIWVHMINRLAGTSGLSSLRSKYNETLENQLSTKNNHFFMKVIAAMMDKNLFDSSNKLNHFYGRVCFWNEVDKQLELFDKRKLSLRPIVEVVLVHEREEQNQQANRFRRDHKTRVSSTIIQKQDIPQTLITVTRIKAFNRKATKIINKPKIVISNLKICKYSKVLLF